MPTQHSGQPNMLVPEPLVHPSPHFLAQLLELADHPLPLGFLAEKQAPVLGLPAVMREAQEVENLRSCPALAPTVLFGKPSELDQPRFLRMQFQCACQCNIPPAP